MLYAIESAQPAISRTKLDGLVEHYGFEEGPATEYFSLHSERDHEHAAQSRQLIEERLAGRRRGPPRRGRGGCPAGQLDAARRRRAPVRALTHDRGRNFALQRGLEKG